jgi:hypothetical protein
VELPVAQSEPSPPATLVVKRHPLEELQTGFRAEVLIADLRESPLEAGRPVHEDIRTAGEEAIFLETDVASASQKPLLETSTAVFLGCKYAVAVLNTLALPTSPL